MSSWVRPGVFEVRARLAWVRVFSALDLPALERPAKATSRPWSGGHWSTLAALMRKRACWHRPMIGFLNDMKESTGCDLVSQRAVSFPFGQRQYIMPQI